MNSERNNLPLLSRQANEISEIQFRLDQYINLYHRMFPGEMKVFETIGIHPLASGPTPNPFCVKAAAEHFGNIGEHSIAVSVAARAIAKALLDVNAIPRIEFRRILLRGLIHDVFKAHELMLGRSRISEEPSQEARLHVLGLLGAQRTPSYLIQEILTAGCETGHQSLASFLDIQANGEMYLVENRIAEKIVFLADALTSTSVPKSRDRTRTYFVPVSRRIKIAAERYPFLLNSGLILNDVGTIEAMNDISNLPTAWKALGSYGELQEFIASEIACEFSARLIPGDSCSKDESEDLMLRLIELDMLEMARGH